MRRSSSLTLRASHSSLLYSCSRPYFPHPPCSRTTTEKPAVDNCFAIIPPAAPEPMTTKSTSVDVGYCFIVVTPSRPNAEGFISRNDLGCDGFNFSGLCVGEDSEMR